MLRAEGGEVQLAANDYGKGRGVYLSGLPYSATNARLLERILFWVAGAEEHYAEWSSSNPDCEVAYFPASRCYAVVNNTGQPQATTVALPGGERVDVELEGSGILWKDYED